MTTVLTRLETTTSEAAREIELILAELLVSTPREPGLLSYEVFRVDGGATTFVITESWRTPEDARRHAELVQRNGTVDRAIAILGRAPQVETLVPFRA